jgi:hypothetical protein
MLDKQAKEALNKWEIENEISLCDTDRILWCEGFKQGVKHLFEYVAKNGGV